MDIIMKTIKITTVGDGATGKGNLLMAFKCPDFQYVYQRYESCLFESFTKELFIDGEIIAVDMHHTAGQVRLIDITIDLNCIVYNDIITCWFLNCSFMILWLLLKCIYSLIILYWMYLNILFMRPPNGRDRKVVGLTATYVIGIYHLYKLWGRIPLTAKCTRNNIMW